MSYFRIPSDMTRRHFMSHLAGAAAMASPAIAFTNSLMASAVDLKKKNKACIMLWMGGGPSHDRHVRHEARRADRRAVQADRHQSRWPAN